MTIYSFPTFIFISDITGPEDEIIEIYNDLQFHLVVPDGQTTFSYTVTGVEPDDIADVDIDLDASVAALNGISIEALEADGEVVSSLIGNVQWGGNTTQVLVFEIENDDSIATVVIRLGGAAFPPMNSVQDWINFDNQITSVGAIPAGSPFGPGSNIPLSSIAGVTILADTDVPGTSGRDTLEGTAGNDVLTPLDNGGDGDIIIGTAGNDFVVFSDTQAGSWYHLDYSNLSGPITVTLDDDWAEASVDKGVNGTDTLVDVFLAANWYMGDGVSFNGTDGNDVFNINMDEDDNWIGLEGGAGNDTFNISGGEIVRLYYGSAASGITANLSTGVIQDGEGGTDQLNVIGDTGVRIEVYGSAYTDTITGSDRNERFILSAGNDTLNAGGGWDVLRYDRSDVPDGVMVNLATGTATGTWDGEAFTHTISNVEEVQGSRTGNDTLIGDDDGNYLRGRGGDDSLLGGLGDDTLRGDEGNDTLIGGDGDDSLSGGEGDDTWIMGFGSDTFDGGAGSDTVHIDVTGVTDIPAGSVLEVHLSTGDAGLVDNPEQRDMLIDVENVTLIGDLAANLTGTFADNLLQSGNGDATLAGYDGNDTLLGGDGNDLLMGGGDDDSLEGGAGNDTLWGGAGNNVMSGEGGNDILGGGNDAETLIGGEGNDSLWSGGGNDEVIGGIGNDEVWSGLGNDSVQGDDGDDLIGGVDGNDTLDGGLGNDTIYAGDGADEGHGGVGNDILWGGLGADYLTGGTGIDLVAGADGNDTLYGDEVAAGPGGDDSVWGGAGDDLAFGGGGNDEVWGGEGNNTLHGEDGNDLIGAGSGNDELTGGAGNDSMYAAGGNDSLDGGSGNDDMWGGTGHDTLMSGDGADTLGGGDGNDMLTDGTGNATLYGGSGDDTMNGGAGDDQFWGGTGADTLVFATGDGNDTAGGFSLADGDRLELDDALWAGHGVLTVAEVVSTFGSVSGNHVELNFDGGESMTLSWLGTTTGLDAAIDIF